MSPEDLGHNEGHSSAGADADGGRAETNIAVTAESLDEQAEAPDPAPPQRPKRVRRALHRFFFPPQGSRRWLRALPWVTVVAIVAGVVVGSAHAWAWTNSPEFCGTFCHTMPPQYAEYKLSPHARVSCVECHIGREFIGKQLPRKAVHTQFIFRMAFGLYEYPIRVKGMRPARDTCETCHSPEKFSDDSVRVRQHYLPDEFNTEYSTYLVLKTGGGSKREGLGRGIHWHIENKIEYLPTDPLDQTIPYVRVTNSDGSVEEYVDTEAGFDPSSVDPGGLKTMDCITCHNRISHTVAAPDASIESSMARGVISSDIPYIRSEGVKVLTTEYADREEAFAGIAEALTSYYKTSYPEFYASDADKVDAAIKEIQRIYSVSVFEEQEVDWNTYPNNVGHVTSPGCFRCHDGKHLNAKKEAVRLECNLCHSIPVVQGSQGLVTDIEIVHGPEPASHLNANWISLHNRAYDKTCANCHTTADAGGTSNTSFCSNSTCHGTVYKYAGFDAPGLRNALEGQVPSTSVEPIPSTSGKPTWGSFVGPLLTAKCGTCHGANPSAGLDLTNYTHAMLGGNDGPVMIPGNSADSILVQVQGSDHFANLSAQELQAVREWIDAGAVEK